MRYSQGEEENIISNIFDVDYKGTLLEIGAFHPEQLSNSRKLILEGWKAVLVEPSPECFKVIEDFYRDNYNVMTLNYAIGSYDGELDFYNNIGALGTAVIEHMEKWKSYDPRFDLIKVPCLSWKTFREKYPIIPYDFISIDTEGMDWEICQQIDFDETCTSIVCIEWTYYGQEIFNYLIKFNFELLYQNGENIIMGRVI